MKRRVFLILLLLIILGVVPKIVVADTVTLVGGYGLYQTGSGGEFTFDPSTGLEWILNNYNSNASTQTRDIVRPGTFQSFCVEGNEHINANATYSVVLSDNAIAGGDGGPHPDPLSIGAAWLYYEFARGILLGYDYTNPGRSGSAGTSADLLQRALWWLEGEQGIAYSAANPFMLAVVTQYGSAAMEDNVKDGQRRIPVMVLNLYNKDGTNAQDSLGVVPEPTTLLLLGLGLVGVAGFRRKFRK